MTRFVRRLIVAMLLGVLVYGAFALYTGLAQMEESLREYRWSTFALALALVSGNYVLRFGKWQYYLARLGVRGVGTLDSFLVFLSGFVLTVTPGKVGEVFKSAVLSQTHRVPVERTAPIVVAERLTDVIAIVVLISLGSTAFAGGIGWASAGTAAVAVGLTVILWPRPVEALFAALSQRGGRLGQAVPKLRNAYASLRMIAAPEALLWPTLLSIIGWGAEGVAFYVILDGFGQSVPLARAMFFYATATLAGALVPVPGGLGVVDGLLRQQLVHVNHVAPGPATAAMMLLRFATLWWAVLVGFAALGILRLRYPAELGNADAFSRSPAK
jgi:uncharacterized membrane protein YbhN (UPF0104 family)